MVESAADVPGETAEWRLSREAREEAAWGRAVGRPTEAADPHVPGDGRFRWWPLPAAYPD